MGLIFQRKMKSHSKRPTLSFRMASSLLSLKASYVTLQPFKHQASETKEDRPSYIVSISLCAQEALKFSLPKTTVHLWPHSSSASPSPLKSLGSVLPFSSTFLSVAPHLESLSPTLVLRELRGVLGSLQETYPTEGPRILVYPMTSESFDGLAASTPSIWNETHSSLFSRSLMVLAFISSSERNEEGSSSWSCLLPPESDRLEACWSPPKSLKIMFEQWLAASGLDPDYYQPTSHFGKDLVLEAPASSGFERVNIYQSNVASFSRHSYISTKDCPPALLPSFSSSSHPMRALYHNGPSGSVSSKDHFVVTWACHSLEDISLSLDETLLLTSEDFQEVSPFEMFEGCLTHAPESTSIEDNGAYFFTMALWSHGANYFKNIVRLQMRSTHFASSRAVTDLSTQLLRFSSKHPDPAIVALIRDLVATTRERFASPSSSSTLETIHEDSTREEKALCPSSFILSFLEMTDRWYEKYLVGTTEGSDDHQRKWNGFWADVLPILQQVRSTATTSQTPPFPPPLAPPILERQFSCAVPPLSSL